MQLKSLWVQRYLSVVWKIDDLNILHVFGLTQKGLFLLALVANYFCHFVCVHVFVCVFMLIVLFLRHFVLGKFVFLHTHSFCS